MPSFQHVACCSHQFTIYCNGCESQWCWFWWVPLVLCHLRHGHVVHMKWACHAFPLALKGPSTFFGICCVIWGIGHFVYLELVMHLLRAHGVKEVMQKTYIWERIATKVCKHRGCRNAYLLLWVIANWFWQHEVCTHNVLVPEPQCCGYSTLCLCKEGCSWWILCGGASRYSIYGRTTKAPPQLMEINLYAIINYIQSMTFCVSKMPCWHLHMETPSQICSLIYEYRV